jgi:hypothetical protein
MSVGLYCSYIKIFSFDNTVLGVRNKTECVCSMGEMNQTVQRELLRKESLSKSHFLHKSNVNYPKIRPPP